MSDDWFLPVFEFVCPGCGRSMVTFSGLRMSPALCGACLTTPGWWMWPPMVKALDPENQRDHSAVTMTIAEVECRAAWMQATLAWLRQCGELC